MLNHWLDRQPETQFANIVLKKQHCPISPQSKASSVILATEIAPKICPTTFYEYYYFLWERYCNSETVIAGNFIIVMRSCYVSYELKKIFITTYTITIFVCRTVDYATSFSNHTHGYSGIHLPVYLGTKPFRFGLFVIFPEAEHQCKHTDCLRQFRMADSMKSRYGGSIWWRLLKAKIYR